jgi:dihydropyrimidinase
MATLIQNGRIVTAERDFYGDLLIEGESIAAWGPCLPTPPDARVIDATGKLVFPGFIDPHVHVHLPFMGTYAKDTYATASRAALQGGVTTLIEMCCPSRQDDPLEAFELWLAKAAESACDYTFHMGVTRFDAGTAAAVAEIARRGVASLKVFLAYRGALGIDDGELYQTLALARRLGLIVTAHCENATLVAELQARLLAEGKTGPEWHEPSRPTIVEAEGVRRLMTFAELTGAHVYCVHTSCQAALEAVQAAHLRGVQAWVEAVIPHLVLDKTYAERPDFEGAKYVMSPPLRDRREQDALWHALRSRLISTVATDHAPFDFDGQKTLGRDDFTKIPNGIPSIEHRVPLLYAHGVARGRIDLRTFVDAASTQAARIFGLYPRKGSLEPGADADVVIFDPAWRGVLSASSHAMAVDYSAFEGWPIEGRAESVWLRGSCQVADGRFVGQLGRGRFLPRDATHG